MSEAEKATLDSREQLLICGIALMREHGFHHTGISDILGAAGVPRGSFYHHFSSKEAFGLEAARRYADDTVNFLNQCLARRDLGPMARLRSFFAAVFDGWRDEDCRHGCLLGTLGQELADTHEDFRRLVARTLGRWDDAIMQALIEAIETKELPPHAQPRVLARMMVDGFQGAALRMKLLRDPAPLEAFLESHFASSSFAGSD